MIERLVETPLIVTLPESELLMFGVTVRFDGITRPVLAGVGLDGVPVGVGAAPAGAGVAAVFAASHCAQVAEVGLPPAA